MRALGGCRSTRQTWFVLVKMSFCFRFIFIFLALTEVALVPLLLLYVIAIPGYG